MPRAGRVLRQFMRDEATETPARAEERKRHRAACEQALREREARFPVLTAENADEAIRWQEQRIRELREAL